MKKEIARPLDHKLIVLGSLIAVLVLTGIGVITNDTRERQGSVERTLKVERFRVTQALCKGGPIADRCRQHALDLVRACLLTPRCAALLREAQDGIAATEVEEIAGPPGEPLGGNGNLSPENTDQPSGGAQHPPTTPKPAPGKGRKPPPPSAVPTPIQPEPILPSGEPFPGEGKAKGLIECVEALDPECVGKGAQGAVEGVGKAIGG